MNNVQFVNDGIVQAPGSRSFANENASGSAASRGQTVQEAVSQKMRDMKVNYGTAWASVQRERPELFDGMKQPRIETPKFKIKS